ASALPPGQIQVTGGTMQTSVAGGLTIRNGVRMANANLTLAGSNPLILDGPVSMAGVENTFNVTSTGLTAVAGQLSGGSSAQLTKTGPGTLVLSGNNSYQSVTNPTAGVIQVQNSTALSQFSVPVIVANGAAVQVLGSGLAVAAPLILNGTGINNGGALENLGGGNNTWSGAITLLTDSTIGADAGTSLTISGVI